MYSISGYGKMIADSVRTDAYVQALRRSVRPGAVVLDIGTGTGIFALLACRFGAGRVYAIEPGNIIHVAREIAEANVFGERIEFIQDLSTRVSLKERADVIISDLRDVLPLFRRHIPSIVDARQRLLASNGLLIPQKDVLWAAVVQAPELYSRFSNPWEESPYGLDMRVVRRYVTHTWCKAQVSPEQLMVKPQSWASLDYRTVKDPDVKGKVTWVAERTGIAHGLIIWFDATLVEGVSFSNAPGAPELIYGHVFSPWPEPVDLIMGDHIMVSLKADLIGEDYLWRWKTRILDQDDSNSVKAEFSQSTFFSLPLSHMELHKQEIGSHPKLHEDGLIDQYIMTWMDGNRSLGDIAQMVRAQFPKQFLRSQDALNRVAGLSKKYCRHMDT